MYTVHLPGSKHFSRTHKVLFAVRPSQQRPFNSVIEMLAILIRI